MGKKVVTFAIANERFSKSYLALLLLLLLSHFSRVLPHRRQPTKLPCPWDSPGKNTGVGCHILLQCKKAKSEREFALSCPNLSMDCCLPGASIHGIFQARVLEWDAIAFLFILIYIVVRLTIPNLPSFSEIGISQLMTITSFFLVNSIKPGQYTQQNVPLKEVVTEKYCSSS